MFDQWLDDHREEIIDTYVALRMKRGDPRSDEALRQGAGFGIDVSIKSVLGEMDWEQATRAGAEKVLETGGSLETLSETARALFLAIKKILEKDRPDQAFEWLGIVGDYTLNGSETVAKVMAENLNKQTVALEEANEALLSEITDRQSAEDEAKTLKTHIEFILGATNTGLDIIDGDFNIRYIDPEWQRVYGDPSGRKCYEYFMGAKDVCEGCGIIKALETETIAVTEETLPKENNRPIQVTTIPFQTEEGEWLVAEVNVDITERKRAEEELKNANDQLEQRVEERTRELEKSEKMFRALTESMHAMVMIASVKEQRAIYANPAAIEVTGYSFEELTTSPPPNLFSAESAKKRDEYLATYLRGEELPKRTEMEIISKAGESHWIETSWAIIDMGDDGLHKVTTSFDITERKIAEEALKESEERFRSLFDRAGDALFIHGEQGHFLQINDEACRLLGYRREELLKLTPGDIHDPSEASKVPERMKELFETGNLMFSSELIAKDGQRTPVEINAKLVEYKGVKSVLSVSRDITERRKAEQALRESEKKFRVLADSTTASIAIVAGDEPRFVYANQTMLDRTGMTWDQFAANTPGDSLTPAAREAGTRAAMEAAEHGDIQHRFEYEDDDGRWIEVNVTQTEIDGEAARIYTSFDITEHKRARAALEESESKFRGLAESTTAHISILLDDKYVYANQAFLDYYGVDMEDLLATTPEDLMMGMMGPEVMAAAEPAWQAAVDRGDDHFRFEFQDVEGTWFQSNVTMMELDGKPSYMATNFDITEHKRAEQALAMNEEKYRTIFDTSGTAMISFGHDSVITMANEEWIELSGYSKEETIGKLTWMPFFSEESLAKMKRYHEMRSKDPSSVPPAYEAQFVDRHGRVHDGIVNIQLVPGTQQRVASFLDMTELKRAQNEMYRADKMAALGQIIAGVAHEINNPNNFIYFNLPILRKYIEAIRPLLEHHLEDDSNLKILNMPYAVFLEDVFKLLENMEHGSKRITGIVSELKNYIRSDDTKDFRSENIDTVVGQVMALIGKQVRKMVKRFDVEVAEGLRPIKMNPGKIEQVLINLVINAGQAADKQDSWVKLEAGPAEDNSGFIEIKVTDNGAGIPKENRDLIFEPFFTSKSREAGTGLGLSISHQILKEHGGTIDVESEIGRGTTFIIRLPVAKE